MTESKLHTLSPQFHDDRALDDALKDNPRLKVLHYWGDTEALDENEGCAVDDACVAAIKTLYASGSRHAVSAQFGGNPLACNPDSHPDAEIIRAWLESTRQPATDLRVIFWLAYIVRNEWAKFPKRTRTEHREIYQRIASLCGELSAAMDETGMSFLRGDGHGFQGLGVYALLTHGEIDAIVSASDHARGLREGSRTLNGYERYLLDLMLHFPVADGFPSMRTLLDRLATEAIRFSERGPLHAQPNKRGAERGYFVRRMGELFQRRYGKQPHEVIAALTTIALGEATDRELVAKLLA